MKKYIVLLFLFLISIARGQNSTKSDIQLPSSPALGIIGIQNSEISKPGNYTGLYSSLISPIISNNGTIPTDLSVEFSPFYLKSQDITIKEIVKTNLYRDLKISIASTKIKNSDTSTFARMGFGLKSNLLNGNIGMISKNNINTVAIPGEVQQVINMIRTFPDYSSTETRVYIEKIQNQHTEFKKKGEKDKATAYAEMANMIKKIIDSNKDNKEAAINELNDYLTKLEKLVQVDNTRWNYSLRTGHFLEIAGALAIDFPTNNIDFSKIQRWSIWLNYTYRANSKYKNIDLGAIIRLSNYSFDPTVFFENEALFGDFGGSISFKVPNSGLIISGELIGKFGFSDLKSNVENNNQFTFKSVTENKWNLTLGYKISDNIIWNISLSEINGNSDYLKENATQFLMGLSAGLLPIKK